MKNAIKKLNQNINNLIDKNIHYISRSDNNYHRLVNNRFETTSATDSLPRRQLSTIDRRRAPPAPTRKTSVPNAKETMASDMTLAPIRSLDDFLLSVNRFQLPQFKDFEKWNKRVVNNLHYYQTNYFLSAIIIFTLIGIIYPTEMLLGLLAMLTAIAIFIYANNNSPQFMDFKRSHPIISLLLIFGGGSLIVYLLSAVLVFLIGILLPIFLVLLHASLRTRNIKNKIANTMETVGLTKTPMSLLLDSFGSEPEPF